MRNRHLLLYRQGARPVSHRRHEGKVAVGASNTRWCSDGFELGGDNQRDCSMLVADLMMQAVEYRFGAGKTVNRPIEWLSDNGSCYTAANTRQFARMLGLKPVTRPVVSPHSNGMAKSFVISVKRNYAHLADRPDSLTVMSALKQ